MAEPFSLINSTMTHDGLRHEEVDQCSTRDDAVHQQEGEDEQKVMDPTYSCCSHQAVPNRKVAKVQFCDDRAKWCCIPRRTRRHPRRPIAADKGIVDVPSSRRMRCFTTISSSTAVLQPLRLQASTVRITAMVTIMILISNVWMHPCQAFPNQHSFVRLRNVVSNMVAGSNTAASSTVSSQSSTPAGEPPAQTPLTDTPTISIAVTNQHGGYEETSPRSTTTFASSSQQRRNRAMDGLSKFHRSILSRNCDRQRFVTGKYPLTVTLTENPTRKWLRTTTTSSSNNAAAETELLVNGTSPLRSLASLDRLQWLDESERTELMQLYNMVSLELVAEIHLERPGYVNILSWHAAGLTAALQRRQMKQSNSWKQRWKKPTARTINDERFDSHDDDVDNETLPNRDRLWVTGFSLSGRRGLLKSVESSGVDDEADVDDNASIVSVNTRTGSTLVWPNEVTHIPATLFSKSPCQSYNDVLTSDTQRTSGDAFHQDALLVCDGFLVPGKDRGGIIVIKHPGNPETEWAVRLTSHGGTDRWFYHRATWIDLTGDGRLSILTARCRISTRLGNRDVTSGIHKTGQLVWLECPKPPLIDHETGTPLERDGTVFDPFSSRHLPWKEHVLCEGPDVMFCVADMDESDDTVEVISSQFFAERVVLHSIQRGPKPKITFQRIIDDRCGAAFACILAELDGVATPKRSPRSVMDSGSTVTNLRPGQSFSHVLVTSHECSYAATSTNHEALPQPLSSLANGYSREESDGGSLFAYRVPNGKGAWKTEAWVRTVVATGFQVNGQLKNMINPGAPGFVYTFHANMADLGSDKQPLIAVAGDCAESAYIFRPSSSNRLLDASEDGTGDRSTQYKLMAELKCEATVGSIGIGYGDFGGVAQESGYAKIYIPCFEKDKILVFALGGGMEEDEGW